MSCWDWRDWIKRPLRAAGGAAVTLVGPIRREYDDRGVPAGGGRVGGARRRPVAVSAKALVQFRLPTEHLPGGCELQGRQLVVPGADEQRCVDLAEAIYDDQRLLAGLLGPFVGCGDWVGHGPRRGLTWRFEAVGFEVFTCCDGTFMVFLAYVEAKR